MITAPFHNACRITLLLKSAQDKVACRIMAGNMAGLPHSYRRLAASKDEIVIEESRRRTGQVLLRCLTGERVDLPHTADKPWRVVSRAQRWTLEAQT